MKNEPAEGIEIVEEHGSFLLIRAGPRFAVVERRAGRIYSMVPGPRKGKPMTPQGMASVMAEGGSLSEDEARALFADLCERGDRLARRIW
jgi:hypothetical protein